MSRALYRTYRSTSFDEVIGQEHITELLKNALQAGNISHAYLLTGPRGVGKTSIARILAHEVNHLAYSENPNLDIIEIDAASNRRIDDIRDLREKVHIAPVAAKYKVYIIDEVHMLTGESFNALLKTLEEPPQHVIFILATTELHKVPATIVSRTQRFHFHPVEQKKVIAHLKNIASKENIAIDDDALEIIAEHGSGSFRDSISLLDQLSNVSDHVTRPLVENVLGRADRELVLALLRALEAGDSVALQSLIRSAEKSGIAAATLTEQLLTAILTGNSAAGFAVLDDLMDVSRAPYPYLKLLASLLKQSRPTSPPAAIAESIPTVVPPKTDTTAAPTTTPAEPAETVKTPPATKTMRQEKAAVVVPPETPKAVELPVVTPILEKKPTQTARFDWPTVKTAAKAKYPALSSLLNHCDPEFDGETLTLSTKYPLHRRKLEQTEHQEHLMEILDATIGMKPVLVMKDAREKKPAPQDDVTRAVAELMGGGESVDV